MTTTRTVTRKRPERPLRTTDVGKMLRQFLTLKFEVTELTARQNSVKADLSNIVETKGFQDDKGSYFLNLDYPVEAPNGQIFSQIKRECRTSKFINEDKAMALLAKKGLTEEATTVVTVLDQDALYVLNQQGKITDKEMDSLIESSDNYAFKPIAD